METGKVKTESNQIENCNVLGGAEMITISREELKQILVKSEKRRLFLNDAANVLVALLGKDGIPKQKWKLISRLTKIINNMDDYEQLFEKFTPEYLGEVFNLLNK